MKFLYCLFIFSVITSFCTGQSQPGGFDEGWQNFSNSDLDGLGNRQVPFDYAGVRSLDTVPQVGIHPRIFFGPSEIPALISRWNNTISGQAVSSNIHAYTTLMHLGYPGSYDQNEEYALDAFGNRYIGNAGHWSTELHYSKLVAQDSTVWDGVAKKRKHMTASMMALEALECMVRADSIDNDTGLSYSERSEMLSTAMMFWAKLALNDPDVNPNTPEHFGTVHMALAYDLHFNNLSQNQRDTIRMALAKIIPSSPRHGGFMNAFANTSNWSTLNSFEILTNLAIEGEVGYNVLLTEKWVRAYHNFLTYGWYPSGAGYEGLGKNYQFVTTAIALATRGYSLLGHPHMKNYMQEFLPSIIQPYGRAFTSYDVWGGSGYHEETGGYKFNPSDIIGLKWAFPNNVFAEGLWRNYIESAYNTNSTGYVYQQISPDDSYSNYLFLAGIFSEDYNQSVPNQNNLDSIVKVDAFFNDRGLGILRSGQDSSSLALQFHCRQDLGGHTHGDRNDFTLSGLGRLWVRKSYSGSHFQPSQFHSMIMIDGKGIAVGDPDGDKCRQPGTILEWTPGESLSKIAGDATYAYSWDWHWSPQDPGVDHPWIGSNGWESVTETWNDFQFIEQNEPHFNISFYEYPHWHQPGKLERMIKRPYNPVEKMYRTVGMFKGNHPFVIISDDAKKDSLTHIYEWTAQLARDLTIESTSVMLTDSNYRADIILKEPSTTGNRRLLVRVLNNNGYDGSTAPGVLEDMEYINFFTELPFTPNPNFARPRLVISNNSVAPDFRILLFPYHEGDELPKTHWNVERDTLSLIWHDESKTIVWGIDAFGRKDFNEVGSCKLVRNTFDDGIGSLRSAIECASAGDTLLFSSGLNGRPINLDSMLIISKDLVIDANGQSISIVNEVISDPFFVIDVAVQLEIIGLEILGNSSASIIENSGTLILNESMVKNFSETGNTVENKSTGNLITLGVNRIE